MPRQIWMLTQADVCFLIDHAINGAKAIGVAVSDRGGRRQYRWTTAHGCCQAREHRGRRRQGVDRGVFSAAEHRLQCAGRPRGGSYGILNAYPGKLVPLPGGQPILIDGACIGGIGISGATGEQDDGLAKTAVAALMKYWGRKE